MHSNKPQFENSNLIYRGFGNKQRKKKSSNLNIFNLKKSAVLNNQQNENQSFEIKNIQKHDESESSFSFKKKEKKLFQLEYANKKINKSNSEEESFNLLSESKSLSVSSQNRVEANQKTQILFGGSSRNAEAQDQLKNFYEVKDQEIKSSRNKKISNNFQSQNLTSIKSNTQYEFLNQSVNITTKFQDFFSSDQQSNSYQENIISLNSQNKQQDYNSSSQNLSDEVSNHSDELLQIQSFEDFLFNNYQSPTTIEIIKANRKKQIDEIDNRCKEISKIYKDIKRNQKLKVQQKEKILILPKYRINNSSGQNLVEKLTINKQDNLSGLKLSESVTEFYQNINQLDDQQESLQNIKITEEVNQNQQYQSKKRKNEFQNIALLDQESNSSNNLKKQIVFSSEKSESKLTEIEIKELMKSPSLKTRGILSQFRKTFNQRDLSIKIHSLSIKKNHFHRNSLIDQDQKIIEPNSASIFYLKNSNSSLDFSKLQKQEPHSPQFHQQNIFEFKKDQQSDTNDKISNENDVLRNKIKIQLNKQQQDDQDVASLITNTEKSLQSLESIDTDQKTESSQQILIKSRFDYILQLITQKKSIVERKMEKKLQYIFKNNLNFNLHDLLMAQSLFDESFQQNQLQSDSKSLNSIENLNGDQNNFKEFQLKYFERNVNQKNINGSQSANSHLQNQKIQLNQAILFNDSIKLADKKVLINQEQNHIELNKDEEVRKKKTEILQPINKEQQTTQVDKNMVQNKIIELFKNQIKQLEKLDKKLKKYQIKKLNKTSREQENQQFIKNMEKKMIYLKKLAESLKGKQIDIGFVQRTDQSEISLFTKFQESNSQSDFTPIDVFRKNIIFSLQNSLQNYNSAKAKLESIRQTNSSLNQQNSSSEGTGFKLVTKIKNQIKLQSEESPMKQFFEKPELILSQKSSLCQDIKKELSMIESQTDTINQPDQDQVNPQQQNQIKSSFLKPLKASSDLKKNISPTNIEKKLSLKQEKELIKFKNNNDQKSQFAQTNKRISINKHHSYNLSVYKKHDQTSNLYGNLLPFQQSRHSKLKEQSHFYKSSNTQVSRNGALNQLLLKRKSKSNQKPSEPNISPKQNETSIHSQQSIFYHSKSLQKEIQSKKQNKSKSPAKLMQTQLIINNYYINEAKITCSSLSISPRNSNQFQNSPVVIQSPDEVCKTKMKNEGMQKIQNAKYALSECKQSQGTRNHRRQTIFVQTKLCASPKHSQQLSINKKDSTNVLQSIHHDLDQLQQLLTKKKKK